jgi:hypothetical protein
VDTPSERPARPTDAAARGEGARRPYEPPRLLKKHSVARTTMVSGGQCTFNPPPC